MATANREKHQPYPWNRWFQYKRFKLERGIGKDYQCQTHSMVAQIRSNAAKLGIRVSIEVLERTIIVTRV